jgi:hypothetical protein
MSKWRDSITGITVDVEDVVCKDCSDCDIPLPDGTENASEQIPSGTKHDRGKLPMHLLSTRAMKGTAAVLRFGANKYGDRNWEGGIKYSRIYGALLRHITAFWEAKKVMTRLVFLTLITPLVVLCFYNILFELVWTICSMIVRGRSSYGNHWNRRPTNSFR